jgi:hypothetical protein
MNAQQLASVAYQPRETGALCGGLGHHKDCLCDLGAVDAALALASVPLSDIPFGKSIAALTGWPEGRQELVDFLCASLGLWERQKELERDDPATIRQLDAMAETYRCKAYDHVESRGNWTKDSPLVTCKKAHAYLADGQTTLEEVCALLDLTPGAVVDAMAFRVGKLRPKSLRSIPEHGLYDFDMDCRRAAKSKVQVARDWDVSIRVVDNWCVVCGLTDGRHLKFKSRRLKNHT